MSTLNIVTRAADGATRSVALDGRLDALTAPELEGYVDQTAPQVTTLILDLEKLSFISSAGLRVIARARKALQSRGGKVLIVNPSPQVQKVFEIVKAVPPREVFRSDDELDWYLANIQNQISAEG